jgi:hypothetical protein
MKAAFFILAFVAVSCSKITDQPESDKTRQGICFVIICDDFGCSCNGDPFAGGGGGGPANGGPNNCSKCVDRGCFYKMMPSGTDICYITMDYYCLEAGRVCP